MLLATILASISALLGFSAAAFAYFHMYDVRFRLDSAERSVQGLWKKVSNVENKDRREIIAEVRDYLAEVEESQPQRGGPDIGEMMLMQMLQGSMQQPMQPEPDQFAAIDGLLGNGGNPEPRDDE